jgi:hypothetical protein
MNEDQWNKVVSSYFSSKKPSQSPFSRYLRWAEANQVYGLIKEKKSNVLDIASEPRVYKHLLEKGFDMTRIDHVPCYRDYLKDMEGNKIYDPEFMENPYTAELKKKYDYAVSVGIFNYYPDPLKLLEYERDALDAKGYCVNAIKTEAHPDSGSKSDTNKTYSHKEIAGLYDKAGLEITDINGVCMYLPKTRSFWRYLYNLLVPGHFLIDMLKYDKKYMLSGDRAWYYIVKAERRK